MNVGAPRRCALFHQRQFARIVRDQKPTREELLEWLRPEHAGVFWTSQRAALLREVEGRVEWSPDVLSPDGEILRFGNFYIWLDTNEVRQF